MLLTTLCADGAPNDCFPWNRPCNPCEEENHWIIDDHSRSADYYDRDQPLLTDNSLAYGWYRSVIHGAKDIAFHRPKENHCQTSSPMWLDGESILVFGNLLITSLSYITHLSIS